MKKYKEALRNLENYVIEKLREEDLSINHFTIEFEVLQQLIDEKVEQESRKDKLIVGSKWECVANCFCENWGDALIIRKGDIIQMQSIHNHTLAINRGIMPTEQFLLCFRPLKEGE